MLSHGIKRDYVSPSYSHLVRARQMSLEDANKTILETGTIDGIAKNQYSS